MNRCGSFPLLSASYSLFSIWTDLKRSEEIPGAPTWRWGEWIWLTGPSGLRRNSLTNWLSRNPEVHYRPYISPPSVPIFSKSYLIPRITTHLPQIHFNIYRELRASAANTPTATTPEDVSHSRGRNVEGRESWEWKTPGLRKKTTTSTVRIPTYR